MTNEQLAMLLGGFEAQLDTALGLVSQDLKDCDAARHSKYIGPSVPFLDSDPEHYALTGDFVALDHIKEVRTRLHKQIKTLTEAKVNENNNLTK